MTRIRTFATALATAALLLGTAFAAGVAFDAAAFDGFEEDEGYVDLALVDGVLTVTFDEPAGALPATMEGTALVLDEDFEEDLLFAADALALYGGLPVSITPFSVTADVEGSGPAIHDAVVARLGQLGLSAEEIHAGGPVRTYLVGDGESEWTVSVTPRGSSATIHVQTR